MTDVIAADAIRKTRDLLAGPMPKTKMLALPAPAAKTRVKKSHVGKKGKRSKLPDDGRLEINGVDVELSPHELILYRAFDGMPAGECISQQTLVEMVGSVAIFFAAMKSLRQKLETCRATVTTVRGEGYRLENVD
jgi:DNA-binding response OmpR family regulator